MKIFAYYSTFDSLLIGRKFNAKLTPLIICSKLFFLGTCKKYDRQVSYFIFENVFI